MYGEIYWLYIRITVFFEIILVAMNGKCILFLLSYLYSWSFSYYPSFDFWRVIDEISIRLCYCLFRIETSSYYWEYKLCLQLSWSFGIYKYLPKHFNLWASIFQTDFWLAIYNQAPWLQNVMTAHDRGPR